MFPAQDERAVGARSSPSLTAIAAASVRVSAPS